MRFEWDEDKNRRNLAKHRVSFETAKLVFDDPQMQSIQDRIVEGEERWQTVGMVSGVLLFVAHTYRDMAGDEVIRMISARKAEPHERRAYAKSQNTQAGEIRALKRMKDSEIDTSDIPPVLDWSKAVVGKFYRPIQKPVTIRLDADVLAWLQGQGEGYETRINALLRSSMERSNSDRFVARISDYGDFGAA